MTTDKKIEQLTYSSAEAAQSLGISERTLWDLAKDGLIPRVKIRGRVLYDPNDLREFVHRQKESNEAAS